MQTARRPELFILIEKTDEYLTLLKKLSVVPFDKYKSAKTNRVSYTKAAEAYVKRQRG